MNRISGSHNKRILEFFIQIVNILFRKIIYIAITPLSFLTLQFFFLLLLKPFLSIDESNFQVLRSGEVIMVGTWFGFSFVLKFGQGFPGDSTVNNPPLNAGDLRDAGSIPGLGRSLGRRHSDPFKYFCLGNPMTKEPGGLHTVHRVAKI